MVLRGKSGGSFHAVGTNSGLETIYDCIETHKMKLNTQNLNTCCRPTKEFNFVVVAVELKAKRVHAKKPKYE